MLCLRSLEVHIFDAVEARILRQAISQFFTLNSEYVRNINKNFSLVNRWRQQRNSMMTLSIWLCLNVSFKGLAGIKVIITYHNKPNWYKSLCLFIIKCLMKNISLLKFIMHFLLLL